jgi:hypothetical protein
MSDSWSRSGLGCAGMTLTDRLVDDHGYDMTTTMLLLTRKHLV